MTPKATSGASRREFLRMLAAGAGAAGLSSTLGGCGKGSSSSRKVIVLGLDGLDPGIVKALIDMGRAPNLAKLAKMGSFTTLGTTMPALSPVAWSSFITGMTPGGHGIGDFIMRDPETYLPVYAIYETPPATRSLKIRGCELPLTGGASISSRQGKPFWAYLTERGIPSVVLKIPTNFPLDETATRALGGMGTPDLADAYGLFNYYTTDPFEDYPELSGGYVQYVTVRDHHVKADLIGPPNTLCPPDAANRDPYAEYLKAPFDIYLDPDQPLVRVDIGGKTVVLEEGKLSEWVPVEFDLLPGVPVTGMSRMLVKQVRPHLQLYISPINIDPENQASAISYPEEYGGELAREIGPFATKGLPGDTKAFDMGVFRDEDYVAQAESILEERMAIFEYEWARFKEGLFYFYVSNTDQDAHMLWRNMDKNHPLHGESDVRFSGYIHHLYERMDELVGRVLPAVDDDTLLLIASDHGFAQFGRQVHLNSWLRERGHLKVKEEAKRKEITTVLDVDWANTNAYALGFNGIYLNLKNREKQGRIEAGSGVAQQLERALIRDLESMVDDFGAKATGDKPVAKVYRRDDLYTGPVTPEMPELLVGYKPGFRHSSESVLVETNPGTKRLIDTNPMAWSGDHSMAKDLVPGVLFSSRAINTERPEILDLPVTILEFFGIGKPGQMVGKNLL